VTKHAGTELPDSSGQGAHREIRAEVAAVGFGGMPLCDVLGLAPRPAGERQSPCAPLHDLAHLAEKHTLAGDCITMHDW
jgi:hypothetical protein